MSQVTMKHEVLAASAIKRFLRILEEALGASVVLTVRPVVSY